MKEKILRCVLCKKEFINTSYYKRKTCSDECYSKYKSKMLIEVAKIRQTGKTLEEIHGKEKAKEIKLKKVNSYKILRKQYGLKKIEEIKLRQGKNKTLEEIHGKEKAKEIRLKISKKQKGKTFKERYGNKKAREIGLKISKSKFVWPKEKIIENLNKLIKRIGPITRTDLNFLNKYYDICSSSTIITRFKSLDNLMIEANIEFKDIFHRRIGKNEREILDEIEKSKEIILLRQFSIAGKYIDGYDKENNIAYEVDEEYHKYRVINDIIRENKIKEILGCEFIRIKG